MILCSQELPPNSIPNSLSLACLVRKIFLFNIKVYLILRSVSGVEEDSVSLKLPYLVRHNSETEKLVRLHHQELLTTCKDGFATKKDEILVRKKIKWMIFHHQLQGHG